MCSHPPSLFDPSGVMREATNSVLANKMWNLLQNTEYVAEVNVKQCNNVVIDGGALIYLLPWKSGETYKNICDMYASHVLNKYGDNTTVVFDGYNKPTTKETTYSRRSKGMIGPIVHFTPTMPLKLKKEIFLSNKTNKQTFINFLSEVMREKGIDTIHAEGDADLLIVNTAVHKHNFDNGMTALIGSDTDLLVLLCFHATMGTMHLYMIPPTGTAERKRIWDIGMLKEKLGADVCENILFLHAFYGCDTTSHIHDIGKGTALQKINSKFYKEHTEIFNKQDVSHQDIARAGEQIFVLTYGGKSGETLDHLRYRKFCEKIATCSIHVHPKALPPTSSAAVQHSYRVYCQVNEWKGNVIEPTEWGWELQEGKLVAITSTKQPAPQELLKILRCGCKRDCTSKNCTCRTYNMKCTYACTECHGTSCANAQQIDMDSDLHSDFQ